MLTPVSFKKGRQSKPRLSEPYVPGRRSERYWTEDQIDVVRQHYAQKGVTFCLSKLPGKTRQSIYQQAKKLGITTNTVSPKAARIGDSLDDTIREVWPTLKGRGAVQRFADELGIRRHTLSNRAMTLGLTLPHRKEPPWTPEEEQLLRLAPVNNPDRASAFFAAHGFKRSPSSIAVRCRRVGLSRRRRDVLSAGAAAAILGIDSKTVTRWITDGELHADRRGTKRLPQQGGDMWTIEFAQFRQFIIDHLDRIDIRKVDKHAFVDLLVNVGAAT